MNKVSDETRMYHLKKESEALVRVCNEIIKVANRIQNCSTLDDIQDIYQSNDFDMLAHVDFIKEDMHRAINEDLMPNDWYCANCGSYDCPDGDSDHTHCNECAVSYEREVV